MSMDWTYIYIFYILHASIPEYEISVHFGIQAAVFELQAILMKKTNAPK